MTKTTATIGKSSVYARKEDSTLRVGTRGKITPANIILTELPKGERRKLRKNLRNSGFSNLAGIRLAA